MYPKRPATTTNRRMSFQFIRRVLSCSNRFYLGIFALCMQGGVASVQPVKKEFVFVALTTAAFTIYEAISVVLVRPHFSVYQQPSAPWRPSPPLSASGSKEQIPPLVLDPPLDQRSQHTEEAHLLDQTTLSSSIAFRKYPMATGRPKNSYMSQDREDKEYLDTEAPQQA